MSVVREFMRTGVECIGEDESLELAARKMRDLDVGSLPICGQDKRLKGIITDRDIVVRCLAEGHDPRNETAAHLAQGKPYCIGADEPLDAAIRMMEEHSVRRLPVLDHDHQLVGMLTQGDLARHAESRTGELVEHISKA